MHLMQLYAVKCDIDLLKLSVLLCVLWFSPSIKLTIPYKTDLLLKVMLIIYFPMYS